MKYWFLFLFGLFILSSCEGDDDVCITGEATPRMKVKFKSSDNKITVLDSLYLDVDYGDNKLINVITAKDVDSVLVPIRVDDNGFTEISVRTRKKGTTSKIKISYTTKSQYVSPACGFKRLYENISASLLVPNPVTKVELNQNNIINENQTHLYLVF